MAFASENQYSFSGFGVDASRRLLLGKDRAPIPLTSKVFDLLLYLVENPGRTLTKDEIMSAVWTDTVVEESNLTQNISILRRALGDARGENAFIATIPGQGYRFVADVETGSTVEPEIVPTADPVSGDKPIRFMKVALLAVLIIAGIVTTAVYFYRTTGRPNANSSRILAILPFKPVVEADSDNALEVGMADTLIARLSNTSGVILRPLSSVRRFSAADQDPQAAGRDLGADAVLDGTIQRQGEKIRVNVRLMDVGSGESLWGGTFDEQYRDIFALQDKIAAKVAEALRLRLRGPEYSQSHATTNVDVYRLYLQGRLFQFRSTPKEIRQAIEFYKQAIELDPGYALAHAALADAYRSLPITSDVDTRTAFPQSKAAASDALRLDPDLAQAHVAMGYVLSWYEWDWKAAEEEFRRAVELDTGSAEAHRGLSILLTMLGRHDEAVTEMKVARELDPLSLPTNALEAQALFYAGRDVEAVERLNKTFEIDSNFWIARLMLARIFIKQKRFDEALVELDRARTASGGNTEAISLSGYIYAQKGDREKAREALAALRAYQTDSYSPAYNIAVVYKGLDETNEALDALEDAVSRRDVRLILLNIDHKWDDLREHPRFIAVLRRVGF